MIQKPYSVQNVYVFPSWERKDPIWPSPSLLSYVHYATPLLPQFIFHWLSNINFTFTIFHLFFVTPKCVDAETAIF